MRGRLYEVKPTYQYCFHQMYIYLQACESEKNITHIFQDKFVTRQNKRLVYKKNTCQLLKCYHIRLGLHTHYGCLSIMQCKISRDISNILIRPNSVLVFAKIITKKEP